MASITTANVAKIASLKKTLGNAEKELYAYDLVHNPSVAPDCDAALVAATADLTSLVGSTGVATQKVLSSGVKVTAPAITGSYVNGYTFTIVDGAITAIVAS